jgi:hypothetical protein
MPIETIDALYAGVVSPDVQNYDGSQNKNEFRDCLEYLDRRLQDIDRDEVWFLEIGAFKGLWALALSILCEKNKKTLRYVTVTWISHNPSNQDIFSTRNHFKEHGIYFELIDANSSLPKTVEQVKTTRNAYDFVFIDGDHSFEGVMQDIANYAGLATELLIFHDINTRSCGVRKAIDTSRVTLNLEISYGNIMGIGIKNCRAETPSPPKRLFRFF